MHIPDGFLSGPACAAGAVVAVAGVAVALRKARGEQRDRDLPVAGLAAAFFLVGDAPIFPVGIGTQGHLLGGMLACALLGPWLGLLTITVTCALQAVVLGDGGISTLGLGVVNLALVPALVGYPLLLALRRLLPATRTALCVAAGIAAWVSVVLSSVIFVVEFDVGAVRHIDMGTLAATTIGTYALIGVLEGVLTALILRAVLGVRPDLVRVGAELDRRRREAALKALRA